MKRVGVVLSWDKMFFWCHLRQLRAGLGLSAREAAWQAGVKPVTWYSWESGAKMPAAVNKAKLVEWLRTKKAQLPGL